MTSAQYYAGGGDYEKNINFKNSYLPSPGQLASRLDSNLTVDIACISLGQIANVSETIIAFQQNNVTRLTFTIPTGEFILSDIKAVFEQNGFTFTISNQVNMFHGDVVISSNFNGKIYLQQQLAYQLGLLDIGTVDIHKNVQHTFQLPIRANCNMIRHLHHLIISTIGLCQFTKQLCYVTLGEVTYSVTLGEVTYFVLGTSDVIKLCSDKYSYFSCKPNLLSAQNLVETSNIENSTFNISTLFGNVVYLKYANFFVNFLAK